jgi:hypothetical protein
MPLTEQQKLIFDTLHYRPPSNGTCFVTNEPGLNLISRDASFLPSLEAYLKEASQTKQRRPSGKAYVIGAYLVIAAKYAPSSLVPFIESLPDEFANEIVTNVSVFFRKMKKSGEYNFKVQPPEELVEFLRKLALSEDSETRFVAQQALKFSGSIKDR